jgi:YHS domain-containing protein
MTKDPVCGMHVDEARPGATAEYRDHVLYFCSTDCRAEFQSDPAAWQPAFESACSETTLRVTLDLRRRRADPGQPRYIKRSQRSTLSGDINSPRLGST